MATAVDASGLRGGDVAQRGRGMGWWDFHDLVVSLGNQKTEARKARKAQCTKIYNKKN